MSEKESSSAAAIHGSMSHSEVKPTRPILADSIVTLIDGMVDAVAEFMPNNDEVHLPFFRKEDVFEIFKLEFQKLYPSRPIPSESYFLSTWKNHRFQVKVRKHHRFTKCDTCQKVA